MTRAAPRRPALLAAALPLIALACAERSGASPSVDPPAASLPREFQVAYASQPKGSARDATGRVPSGSRLEVATLDGGPPRDLAPGFDAAGAPCASFDGASVVFAGRKSAKDVDAIWEIDVRDVAGGGAPRRVATLPDGDCGSPAYLPHGEVVFTGPSAGGVGLWVAPLAGGGALRRITYFAADTVTDPAVLADGRIVFAIPELRARRARNGPTVLLFVHSDGTGVRALHGEGAGLLRRRRPRETYDRGLVFVGAPDPDHDRGSVFRIDARRPALAATLLQAGEFRSAEPLPDGSLLATRRPEVAPPGAATAAATVGVFLVGRNGETRTVVDHPDRDEVDAVPLLPRRVPKGHLSVVDARKSTGRVYCMDVHLDRTAAEGRAGKPVAVRVLEETAPAKPGGRTGLRVLGEAAIEDDGSFYLELPADRALRMQTLGEGGALLRSSGPRFWVRPNEAIGCIGCHEQAGAAAPNFRPKAVTKPAVRLVGSSEAAATPVEPPR